jgi:hypothetical protein
MGHHRSHLPAAATATRTGGQGGRSGGPERVDSLFVVSVVIITFFLCACVLRALLRCPPARGRFVRFAKKYFI